eukprot:TRINITY_DN153_c0_g1_i1.p1 TRINITY_DN153_c0_g1~~TRINITY_DN153_c0_g1_i1.p1  ORF type:complete len:428 (+),score=146.09 TRINITY_DN153_c0_g1_i1:57-1340(+)
MEGKVSSENLELQDLASFGVSENNSELALRGEVTEREDDGYFASKEVVANAVQGQADDENSDVVVSMNNIHKTYLLGVEGVPALRGVSMTVRRGEFLCIYGTSGGGKTSMLNIIGTIDKPTKGDLWIGGLRIDSKTSDTDLALLRLKKIGFVFQTFNLISSLTALENVEMPMILAGDLSRAERRERAVALLESVGIGERLNHYPSQLSGGEQQRVTIARAIANKPDILLLDEPTGDLDSVNSLIVLKLLTDLNKHQNITLIMVTHDVGLKFFADRVIWMRDGKIQRVENVPEKKKKENYAKLYADLEEIQRNKRAKQLQQLQQVNGDGLEEGEEEPVVIPLSIPSLPSLSPTLLDLPSTTSDTPTLPSPVPSSTPTNTTTTAITASSTSLPTSKSSFGQTSMRRPGDYEILSWKTSPNHRQPTVVLT